jgi:hypothetical protein
MNRAKKYKIISEIFNNMLRRYEISYISISVGKPEVNRIVSI